MRTSAPDESVQVAEAANSRSGLWWPLALVVGDFLSFMLFAGLGRETHN